MSDSQAKVWATLRDGLPAKRPTSSLQKALDERMTLAEAISLCAMIVEYYPNGGHGAGKSYIGALAANLARYPASVARRCADRTSGIACECKFLPTIADIIAWCERETEPLYLRSREAEQIQAQRAVRADYEAENIARKGRLSYSELKSKYGDWHHGWEPPGDTARRLEAAARVALVADIGQEAFDHLPSGNSRA